MHWVLQVLFTLKPLSMKLKSKELLQEIYLYLKDQDSGTNEKITYSLSANNSLMRAIGNGWLIQSKATDTTSCQLLTEIQNKLANVVQKQPNKTHYIDILHLGNNAPNDSFQSQLADSIYSIAQNANSAVIVRYLEGNQAGNANDYFLRLLQQKTYGAASKVTLYTASINYPWVDGSFPSIFKDIGSWNHAKIFAIDGVISFVGGQNYWSDYVPPSTPPYDVSIQVSGEATVAGHSFANFLWQYVASPIDSSTVHKAWVLGPQKTVTKDLPPPFDPANFPTPPQPEQIPILAVGNLGLWGWQQQMLAAYDLMTATILHPKKTYTELENATNRAGLFPFTPLSTYPKTFQASSTARCLLLQNVQTNGHIRISQQKLANTDIEPSTGEVVWPMQFLNDIVNAIKNKNATVDILVSNHVPGNSPVGGYSDDMGAAALTGVIQDLLGQHVSKSRALQLTNDLLTVKEMPDGTYNHAKVCIVDDQAFYVGSDNAYPAYLQEFGYIVGDSNTTKNFTNIYWNNIWALAVLPTVKKKAKAKPKAKKKQLYV